MPKKSHKSHRSTNSKNAAANEKNPQHNEEESAVAPAASEQTTEGAIATTKGSSKKAATHEHQGGCCESGVDSCAIEQQHQHTPIPLKEIPTTPVVLPECYKKGTQINGIEYYFEQYTHSAEDLDSIMRLIAADLSEPYSIFTYRYFLQSWPDLCILCRRSSDGATIGCIVNKVERKAMNQNIIRGYVAMLAVDVDYRFGGIGSRLVTAAVDLMRAKQCDLIYLETPIDNKAALRLYESLGFVRDKRLVRYYMTGSDAFRLKLWLH